LYDYHRVLFLSRATRVTLKLGRPTWLGESVKVSLPRAMDAAAAHAWESFLITGMLGTRPP
jgi:hypothetical protein